MFVIVDDNNDEHDEGRYKNDDQDDLDAMRKNEALKVCSFSYVIKEVSY